VGAVDIVEELKKGKPLKEIVEELSSVSDENYSNLFAS